MFVSTRASKYIMKRLQDNSCITLTAPFGVGKSIISRHTALVFQKHAYQIIPVYSPIDIRNYYQLGKKTVFVVDDICGNFTADQHQIESWEQMLPVIKTVLEDNCCKIIVSCRLQVYKDDKFNTLSPFKSCECNLTSNKLRLSFEEKTNIAQMYIGTNLNKVHELLLNCEFFPLLCSLYHGGKHGDVEVLFKIFFNIYKNELDNIRMHGREGRYKICSLVLIVLNNNQLEDKWFEDIIIDKKRIIEDVCDACAINKYIPIKTIKRTLDTLDGTFICKQNGTYRTIHNKLFEFLAHYFGQIMIECLINHGDSYLVQERFIWQKPPDKKNDNMDFVIDLPNCYLKLYLERMIKDWSAGMVAVVFRNSNMKIPSFRQRLLQYLQQMDRPQQETLTNTKDTVIPNEDCASGNTPLIMSCYHGHTDMMQWMLFHDVDVDQCNDDGSTGLSIASQEGQSNIVELLLEKNSEVNLCDKNGCSPLYWASKKGHTKIVKLLLEKDPNVDECDKDGCSPLFMACQEGHTHIVRLMLEKNPNVDLCNRKEFTPLIQSCLYNHTSIVKLLLKHNPNINAQTYNGGNALYFSALNGNIDITQLLLKTNAICNICIQSKQSMTNTFTNHPDYTLDLVKQSTFDILVNNTSSHATNYVRKKTVDYTFGVVAGSSPLQIACFMGRIDVVCCLLDFNAHINITKEDGTTPLFYACEVGHVDVVRLLLDKGADTRICRVDGKSPLNIAIDNKHRSVEYMVAEYMKKEDTLPN
ncbi:Hypothetical predicted protein [Mytilus galloprovincialis]|uniref:Novel STAND NTPase 3 domain-containing protein n=1 Tax=Mytilus galloprovincialis TaxID=29158 RepID=A0A8B6CNY2_MYTGA|nr:Hypothetical predicted protein [Mytilus galloprovincialis]